MAQLLRLDHCANLLVLLSVVLLGTSNWGSAMNGSGWKSIGAFFWRDQSGASLLEYSVLLGILLIVSFTTLAAVADWANGQWLALESAVTQGAGGT